VEKEAVKPEEEETGTRMDRNGSITEVRNGRSRKLAAGTVTVPGVSSRYRYRIVPIRSKSYVESRINK
jgi:hypothetical protein